MAAWPAGLPQKPLSDGFSEQPPNLLVRSPMDVGPAKVRRRATAGVTKMSCAFQMTLDQLTTFRGFLHDDIKDGALTYTWLHPITGASGNYRLAEAPTYEPVANGLAWRVVLILELLP